MKVSKWVEFEKEIDVEIDCDDIRQALMDEEPDTAKAAMRLLNRVADVLAAITPEMIADFPDPTKDRVFKFLSEQAAKYAPVSA